MTTELTKAAQQALEALKNVTDYDQINAARRALQSALTQRPAAQTEREAFEAWTQSQPYGKYPLRRDQEGQYQADETDVAWDAWQARASLPTQPAAQATPRSDNFPSGPVEDFGQGSVMFGNKD